MAYTKTAWVNDAPPDIDADNLNKMEQGIYDAQFPEGGSDGQLLSKTATGLGWVNPPNSAVWGGITGTLSNQSDLNNALGAKANASTLATVESSSTASKAYSVGSYLVYNGILYRVTAAISSGQTLTPGTNITATNAGAELASLNNDLTSIKTLDNFFGYKDRTINNVSIPYDNYYASIGDIYNDWNIPTGAYLTSLYIRGWSGAPGLISLVTSSDGRGVYVYCTKAGTISSFSVRIWYARF